MKKSIVFTQSGRAVVLPAVRPLREGVLDEVMQVVRDAELPGRRFGRGGEFFGVRHYAPGDSRRMIAWRLSARIDELVTRETAEPTAPTLHIALAFDTIEPDEGRKAEVNERLIEVVASVVVDALASGAEVGLSVPSNTITIRPARGLAHTHAILRALALVDPAIDHTHPSQGAPQLDETNHSPGVASVYVGPPEAAPPGAIRLDEEALVHVSPFEALYTKAEGVRA